MRTIKTIAQQQEFLSRHFELDSIEHKWSCRGYGNSKLFDRLGYQITKASGCGYDRFGTVVGQMIEKYFADELLILAKRECKGRGKSRKTSNNFYGLFYNKEKDYAYVDGGCGIDCMKRILNKIGFELNYINETKGSVTGSQFYQLAPISKHTRKYF